MKIPSAFLLMCLTFGAALFSAQPGAEKPVWHEDLATAQRIARRDGKPIFAVLVCRH
jgi:hypothetical protein